MYHNTNHEWHTFPLLPALFNYAVMFKVNRSIQVSTVNNSMSIVCSQIFLEPHSQAYGSVLGDHLFCIKGSLGMVFLKKGTGSLYSPLSTFIMLSHLQVYNDQWNVSNFINCVKKSTVHCSNSLVQLIKWWQGPTFMSMHKLVQKNWPNMKIGMAEPPYLHPLPTQYSALLNRQKS